MQRSGAITRSAWAERSLAVAALSLALLAAAGGAAGVRYLFDEYQGEFWIGLASVTTLLVAGQALSGAIDRRRRRDRWSAERAGFSRGTQLTLAEQALEHPRQTTVPHQTDLMSHLLAEIELVQEQLTELVSQVNGEAGGERRGGGRHARPVLVDVRTDEEVEEFADDDVPTLLVADDADDFDDDYGDEPYGVGNVLRITDRIDLDAAARGRRVLAARDDDDEDEPRRTVVDLSAHGTEDPLDEDDDDADDTDDWFDDTDDDLDDDLDDGDDDDEGVDTVQAHDAGPPGADDDTAERPAVDTAVDSAVDTAVDPARTSGVDRPGRRDRP